MPTQEDINHQLQLLATYRATLRHRLNQLAIHGDADAPPVVVHDIAQALRFERFPWQPGSIMVVK